MMAIINSGNAQQTSNITSKVEIEKRDQELIKTLVKLASDGIQGICNPNELEKIFEIKINNIEEYFNKSKTLIHRTEEISPLNQENKLTGTYTQFFKEDKISCNLRIYFQERRLCFPGSHEMNVFIGKDALYGSPPPGRATRDISYEFISNSGEKVAIGFGNNNVECANGFSISVQGYKNDRIVQ